MPQTIRILHVLHAFSAGGLENGIVNIINRLPDHFHHELCLLSKSGQFIERLQRPVVVHEMDRKAGNDMRMIFRLRELFRARNIDIVHTRNWAAFDGVLAACLTSRPVLIHGEHGRDISDPHGLVYRRNLARRLLSFRARKFVAVSKDLHTWLENTVRIPASKLAFIPNGVDTERFSPGRDLKLRAELGIGSDEFVIGTIGRLDPVKNHAGLVRAVDALNRDGHRARLVIVGDGPIRKDVEGNLQSSFLTSEAMLLGYRPDVERLYRIFDVFVLNSFAEGMSNTLLEAMASGLPIVCTAVGGNIELISDRKTGILVPAGDDAAMTEALRQYITSPANPKTYASNARQFAVEKFSLGRMVEQYNSLYQSLAS